MTPHEVANTFHAHRIADGQWRGKCPAHDGKSHNSLAIRAANDGKTLVKCWGGCQTPEVLTAAGLEWSDLFYDSHPSSSHSRRRIDPKVALQHRAYKGLLEWKEKTDATVRYRILRRHRLVTQGERLIAQGRVDRGWDWMSLGYVGLCRLEWLADLLSSNQPQDWLRARRFLKGSQ